MNTQPKNKIYVLVIAVFIFTSFVLMACGGSGCGDTVSWDNPQCQAELQAQGSQIVDSAMNGTSPVEQAVGDMLAGDNPQNTLSNP